MAIIDTGWVRVQDGQTTNVILPVGRIKSREVQYRGAQKAEEQMDSHTISSSGQGAADFVTNLYHALPPVPAGYAFSHHEASTSISTANPNNWSVTVELPGSTPKVNSGYGTSGSVSDSTWTNRVWRACWHSAWAAVPYNWVASVTTWGVKTVQIQTLNPRITVNGQQTQHTGTVNNGATTPWYDAAGFVAGTTNVVTHNVDGSGQVDVQIRIEVIEGIETTLLEPEQFARRTRSTILFRLKAAPDPGFAGERYHATIEAERNPEFTWNSKDDQTDWKYQDPGGAWLPLPVEGAPIAAPLKFTPPGDDMAIARWSWRARAWDEELGIWGPWSEEWQFRLMLVVVERFALEVAGHELYPESIDIAQTSNGELGSIEFVLVAEEGTYVPQDGDPVVLGVRDATSGTDQFEGRVQGNPQRLAAATYRVRVTLPDSILAERFILADYAAQDVGLTLKQIVDTYCAGLDSSGINISIGVTRPVAALGRTALDVFREVHDQHGVLFSVNPTDSVVHVVKPADLEDAILICVRGQPG